MVQRFVYQPGLSRRTSTSAAESKLELTTLPGYIRAGIQLTTERQTHIHNIADVDIRRRSAPEHRLQPRLSKLRDAHPASGTLLAQPRHCPSSAPIIPANGGRDLCFDIWPPQARTLAAARLPERRYTLLRLDRT
ncbi:hypothetical protein PsYK624_122100 [Phanerochaete sordida]|uniref:Uncharacterized protein n=1 Tax=Phanerochaete sordida TaxID=48140 RepID=A0A9P3GIZ8_9APHY|nr:hypothetical protein PsYK624_122100 [Phanerochaete sordida]